MDARAGVQRQMPSKPVWIVEAERSSSAVGAVDLADQMVSGLPTAPAEERRSIDPMRATDRYRLVMPYAEDV